MDDSINMDIINKIKILGLSQERVNQLQSMKLKAPVFDINKVKLINTVETINVDDVVGVCRNNTANTWLLMLYDEFCHKNSNFEEFNYSSFKKLLLNEPLDGLPIVYEYQNEYYIGGNGLHRLTIAKCLGGMTAKVAVCKIN